MMAPRWAFAATAFYALNPNLLYLSTTAMTEPLFLMLLIWTTLLTVECVFAIKSSKQSVVSRRLTFVVMGRIVAQKLADGTSRVRGHAARGERPSAEAEALEPL